MEKDDEFFMRLALEQAQLAYDHQEVPVGAIVVLDDEVIGRGYNQPISTHDPSAHAEMVAIRDAATRVGNYRLPGATLYVTIEPCTMCTGLMIHSRISRLVYGATEPKAGVIESTINILNNKFYNHKIDVRPGLMSNDCSAIMSAFFEERRQQKKKNKKTP